LGVVTRAVRNISRRKIRALLVIIALGFSLAIMISIPQGISANQALTQNLSQNLGNTITQTEATINLTSTEIDCSLTPTYSGFGFGGGAGAFGGGGGFYARNFTGFRGGGGLAGAFGAGAFGGGTTPMNESLYSDLSTIQGVVAVVPILQASEGQNETVPVSFNGYSTTITRFIVEYTIEGIPLISSLVNNYPILPTNITAGNGLQAGQSGVALLSENNTSYFGVNVGDNVTILGQPFIVVGVHGTSSVGDRLTLYMNLSDAQAITNNVGVVTSFEVFADNAADVSAVANAISAAHPELTVTTAQDRLTQLTALQDNYNTALASAQSTINQTQSTAVMEIVVAVAATSLIVLFVMLYTVRERTREIGTLKAIGFSNQTVMGQFMLEGVLLSLMAGLVGIAIGSFAAPILTNMLLPHVTGVGSRVFFGGGGSATLSSASQTIALSPELALIGLGAAVALGALGSLYPAWRASRTRPAEAMRYE
jgi:ABC-type antimicrobial peptide transport system permease subunit